MGIKKTNLFQPLCIVWAVFFSWIAIRNWATQAKEHTQTKNKKAIKKSGAIENASKKEKKTTVERNQRKTDTQRQKKTTNKQNMKKKQKRKNVCANLQGRMFVRQWMLARIWLFLPSGRSHSFIFILGGLLLVASEAGLKAWYPFLAVLQVAT